MKVYYSSLKGTVWMNNDNINRVTTILEIMDL